MAKPAVPRSLATGGKALWSDLAYDGMPVHEIALLTEACRARDRLDKLDLILSGEVETWAALVHRTRTSDYELHIDDALAKANQTAGVLKNLLAELPAPAAAPAAKPKGTALDELNARRAQRAPGDGHSTRSRTAARRRK